jgi:Na+/proline symporter
VIEGGGLDTIRYGLNGYSGTYTSLFSGDGWNVFLTFGLSASIGLMAGPFGDQAFWQRAFSVKREDVKSAFLIAPWIFALVPLGMGMLGFLAAGMHMKAVNSSYINVQVITQLLPTWVVVLFAGMFLAGLTSKLDTNLASISSLAGDDVAGRYQLPDKWYWDVIVRIFGGTGADRGSLAFSRFAMLVLVGGGIGIANIHGIRLEYLFLTYGTLRSGTLLPTIITLLKRNVSEPAMFYGILLSLTAGLPMFGIGVVWHILWLSLTGTLFTVIFPGMVVLVGSALKNARA